jgi:hypothetical protein
MDEQGEKKGQNRMFNVHSVRTPELMREPFIVWNWVLPVWW